MTAVTMATVLRVAAHHAAHGSRLVLSADDWRDLRAGNPRLPEYAAALAMMTEVHNGSRS